MNKYIKAILLKWVQANVDRKHKRVQQIFDKSNFAQRMKSGKHCRQKLNMCPEDIPDKDCL